MRERVAIVGGGIAGLASAEAFLRAGARVSVYEASGCVGGVVGTRLAEEYLLESGPDGFFAGTPSIEALVDRLALRSEVIDVEPGWAGLVRAGRVVPLPAHLWNGVPYRRLEVLGSPALALADRLRLLGEPRRPRRPAGGPSESLDAMLVRRLGAGAARGLVGPLLAGVHAGHARELEAASVAPALVAAERETGSWLRAARAAGAAGRTRAAPGRASKASRPLRSFADGMGELAERLAAWVADAGAEMCTWSPVARLARGANAWWLRIGREGSGTERGAVEDAEVGPFDRVVLAVRPVALADLVEPIAPEAAAAAAAIRSADAALVHLAGERLPDGGRRLLHGAIVPPEEPGPLAAFTVASAKWPGRAPAGRLLVRASLRAGADPEAVPAALERLLGVEGLRILAVDDLAAVWPVMTLGHEDRVDAVRAAAARLPGLQIAGAAWDGVGLGAILGAAARLPEAGRRSTRG